MSTYELARDYKKRVEDELLNNILPFWIKHTQDAENGGFYGEISNELQINKTSPLSSVLCTRILWTYSQAYRLFQRPEYLTMAERAYQYLVTRFWDREHSGVFWMLDYKGNPISTRKQYYAQAFAIYALSEYFRATGEVESLKKAVELYECIEKYSYDSVNGGYIEAGDRYWKPLDDMRLHDEALNVSKSMNTHLHIMEAYTNLLRVWRDPGLLKKQEELIRLTMDKIIHPDTYHFILFFDNEWNTESDLVSYGHDIEGSWLLTEAAEVLGDPVLLQKAGEIAVKMTQAVYREGIDTDGGLLYEAGPTGLIDSNKHWWPQAEACIGFLNSYQISKDPAFLSMSLRSWEFIENNIVDHKNGEWFRSVTRERVVNIEPKVSPWKCPYHNARACYELIDRLKIIMEVCER